MDGNCARVQSLIQLLLDGRIDPKERMALDSHLSTCEACRSLVEKYSRISSSVSEWARPSIFDDPGAQFDARVIQALEAQTRATPWLSDMRVALPAILASVLAICGGVWLARGAGLWSTIAASLAPADWLRATAQMPDAIREIAISSRNAIGGVLASGASVSVPSWTAEAGAAAILVNIYFVGQALLNRRAQSA